MAAAALTSCAPNAQGALRYYMPRLISRAAVAIILPIGARTRPRSGVRAQSFASSKGRRAPTPRGCLARFRQNPNGRGGTHFWPSVAKSRKPTMISPQHGCDRGTAPCFVDEVAVMARTPNHGRTRCALCKVGQGCASLCGRDTKSRPVLGAAGPLIPE